MAPILAYWNGRGIAEHIRLLLHYLGVEYEDKFYHIGPPPEFSRKEWFDVKFNLGLDLPNDDDEKQFLKGLPDKLKQYEKYLGEKQWLTGDKISYPDFNLCEVLIKLKRFDPTCLEDFPKLTAYLSKFENLPQLKEYLASSEFKNRK